MTKQPFALSRRGFTKALGAGAAYAAVQPISLPTTALYLFSAPVASNDVVRLSSNENPYGPSPAALRAMTDAFGLAWRYPDEYADLLVEEIASLNNVSRNQVLLGNGSGEILKLSAVAFTGPGKKLVVADPTFEALAHHAQTNRADVTKVKLKTDYSHDLPKMAGINDAALIYVCNPNNPTASVTPNIDLRAFLTKTPQQTIVLVDEAYHHYADTRDYESVIPLVRDCPDLIVVRTFSKIYGMAGLRCGYCIGRPELIEKMRVNQTWDSINIMALVAARASLKDSGHVEQGRQRNHEVKKYVYSELDKLGYNCIPSEANFFMIDLRREVKPMIASLLKRGVEVGRFFPSLPNFMRVTIGTRAQMETFVSAFREVMA